MKSHRTKLGVTSALLAFAALAASAGAGTSQFDNGYQGRVEKDPSTYFGFDVAKSGGQTKVKKVTAVISYHCQGSAGGGPTQFQGTGQGSLNVHKDKTFAGTMNVPFELRGGSGVPQITYKVKGKLQKHGKAKGTLDAEFLIPGEIRGGNPPTNCYSGKLGWKVKKGAHVTVSFGPRGGLR